MYCGEFELVCKAFVVFLLLLQRLKKFANIDVINSIGARIWLPARGSLWTDTPLLSADLPSYEH